MTNTSIETVSPPNPEPAISAPQLSVLPDPTPKKKIRNGKIARLPYILRDMVNRMLRDHIPYDSIREALLEKGVHVTERNISNWKTHGGYEAWRLEQDRALETHLFQDNLTDHEVRDVSVFDEYRGEQIGAGKRSLAFRVAFGSAERTLTDEEAAVVRGRIVDALRERFGAGLRA